MQLCLTQNELCSAFIVSYACITSQTISRLDPVLQYWSAKFLPNPSITLITGTRIQMTLAAINLESNIHFCQSLFLLNVVEIEFCRIQPNQRTVVKIQSYEEYCKKLCMGCWLRKKTPYGINQYMVYRTGLSKRSKIVSISFVHLPLTNKCMATF